MTFAYRSLWRTVTATALAMMALGMLIAVSPQAAQAHARLSSSTPAPDSTVTQAPTTVTIHFGEDVQPAGSDIIVYDAKGNKVSTGPAQVDRTDPKTMTVQMAGTDSEEYLVVWHTISLDDGDPATGAFTFNVGAQASTPAAQPTPTNSGGAGVTATGGSSGAPVWLVVLAGILGLVIGAGGVLAFAGRKG